MIFHVPLVRHLFAKTINRSVGSAAAFLFEQRAGIGHILLHLGGLRRNVEHVFPGAKGFIRPGFDKVALNS